MIAVGVNELHRVQLGVRFEVVDLRQPSSNFDLVAKHFDSVQTIHRCFSIARSHGCKACVIESIRDMGLLEDDARELRTLVGRCAPESRRISFWSRRPRKFFGRLVLPRSRHLIGYAIVRKDGIEDEMATWYVFESVFRKYGHRHNCVSFPGAYAVTVWRRLCSLQGVMYCQQNKLNKRCAHVALRSLLSRCVEEKDVPYSRINEIVAESAKAQGKPYSPKGGLTALQIRAVLDAFGVRYRDMDYEKAAEYAVQGKIGQVPGWEALKPAEQERRRQEMLSEELARVRADMPYSKFLYDGAESGIGSLLGFRVHDHEESRHIIPVFGHTFNKDSWVSGSRRFYFGDDAKAAAYIQSDNWTSSYIGHDDNFGSDFCIPRAYVLPEDVAYVAELFCKGVVFPGAEAEALAVKVLSNLEEQFDGENPWVVRFVDALDDGNVILRSVSMPSRRYFDHLSEIRDWNRQKEDRRMIGALSQTRVPRYVWVVEISLPQLFPANERKLGEVVIDATSAAWIASFKKGSITDVVLKSIMWVRLPGAYYHPVKVAHAPDGDRLRFERQTSCLTSHVPVVSLSPTQEGSLDKVE